jgi:hypothetical protein
MRTGVGTGENADMMDIIQDWIVDRRSLLNCDNNFALLSRSLVQCMKGFGRQANTG